MFEYAKSCESCVTKPCQVGCPLNNDITDFIWHIKKKDFKTSFEILTKTSVLMPLCGRICPHQNQCEGKCVKAVYYKPVEIGKLEAYIGDLALSMNWKLPTSDANLKYKVAVVGGGPAGLTCAQFLNRYGVNVTIFEKRELLGGLMQYGIPDFRLDKDIVQQWMTKIVESGIEVKNNVKFGTDVTLEQLQKEYDAVFLSFGSNVPNKLNIEGENFKNVFGANKMLENGVELDYTGKTVYIIGGGNVSMDAARTIKRQGAEHVIVVYRRGEREMTADKDEIRAAKKDGVEFLFYANLVKIYGKQKAEKLEFVKTILYKRGNDSRLLPTNMHSTNFKVPCDYLIMAIGSHVDEKILENLGLELNEYNRIKVDNKLMTSVPGVFAAGDVASKGGTVAYAARAGRDAADSIFEYLKTLKK